MELTEAQDFLIIQKEQAVLTLTELLSSIPDQFQYPEDVTDFVESDAIGQEIL